MTTLTPRSVSFEEEDTFYTPRSNNLGIPLEEAMSTTSNRMYTRRKSLILQFHQLTSDMAPKNDEDKKFMLYKPYREVVGKLLYV